MKAITEFNTWGIVLLLLALIFLIFNAAAAATPNEEETILGTVVESDWNDEGEVIAVAIQVVTEVEGEEETPERIIEDYLVADTDKGRELISLVGEQVEATGVIKTDGDGNKTILVSAFSLVEI